MASLQDNSPISISTPLGEGELLLVEMSGTEQLGRLFQYQLTLYSKNEEINIDDILGGNVTIKLDLVDGSQRCFNGFVSRFSQVDRIKRGFAVYEATLHPWLWFLTRTADCRIFQEKTVPDIIKEVINDDNFSDIEDKLNGTYREWEYCVQYRESDFNFVSRLMEQEGIYYYFLHEEGKHKLVLCDSTGAHQPIDGGDELDYHQSEGARGDRGTVRNWSLTRAVQPGAYAQTDYDFKQPKKDLLVNRIIQHEHAEADREVFDYPGEYLEMSDGDQYALERIEELHAGFEQVSGKTDVRSMTTGCLFKLSGNPRGDQDREYLVTGVSYQLDTGESSAGSRSYGSYYECSFTAIDSKTVYRPARATPKPVVQGPQTAVVVGPSGEEIFPDEYGRVKVQFHWDRQGGNDENSSCWIRVAQSWAGGGWGAQFIPRIGQEVMVEFLEGDPDRPIITGRVYNADNMPPYTLPDNKTQSGVKTRSTKGGGSDNFNEIRFEDKKGSEELYVQAEKDHNQLTKNDRSETVGNDRSLDVGNDKSETVGNDKTINVGSNHTETIGVDESLTVGSNRTITVGSNHSETVGSNMTITIASNLTETVAINYAETVGAAMELTVGAMMAETVGANKEQNIGVNKSVSVGKDASEDIGSNRDLTVGKDQNVKVGKNLTIDAGDQITIKTGKASITMKKDGTIDISGKDITINGKGEINIKASKNITMKGKKILEN